MSAKNSFRDLIISGPTASGKSSVALSIAHDIGGEIINVDSVQVYRGADIGSAKVAASDRLGIRHHLIDIINPDQSLNAAQFCAMASAAQQEVRSRDKQPILVGGSTMYITSYLHGLCALPAASTKTRAALSALSDEALFERLAEVDPESAASLNMRDRLRVVRALEVYEDFGLKASEARRQHGHKQVLHPALIIVLCSERSTLYDRINQRASDMIRSGLIEEARSILDQYGPEAALFSCIGYQQALLHLRGELSAEEARCQIAMHTRRYAKRQMTFWRNEPDKRGWKRLGHLGGSREAADIAEPVHDLDGVKAIRLAYGPLLSLIRKKLSCEERSDWNRNPIEVWYVQFED